MPLPSSLTKLQTTDRVTNTSGTPATARRARPGRIQSKMLQDPKANDQAKLLQLQCHHRCKRAVDQYIYNS